MIWLIRQILFLRNAIIARDSAKQLAAGFACGIVLGLLPKGNLLAILVATLICSTRVSLGTAMVSALLFSLIGYFSDPLTDRMGQAFLSYPAFVPFWTMIYRWPLVPWTSFNNTVVMGSLVLGLLLWCPAYWFAIPCFARYRRWLGHDADNQEADNHDADCPALADSAGANDTCLASDESEATESKSPPQLPADAEPVDRFTIPLAERVDTRPPRETHSFDDSGSNREVLPGDSPSPEPRWVHGTPLHSSDDPRTRAPLPDDSRSISLPAAESASRSDETETEAVRPETYPSIVILRAPWVADTLPIGSLDAESSAAGPSPSDSDGSASAWPGPALPPIAAAARREAS